MTTICQALCTYYHIKNITYDFDQIQQDRYNESKGRIRDCEWLHDLLRPLPKFMVKEWLESNEVRSIHSSQPFSVQFSSISQSCPTLCNPMNRSMPGLPVHHQLPEFTQTHVHQVSDAIQPSHALSSHSPPAPNPSQHQSLFQWVNSSHEVAKVLEFQL